MADQKSEEVRLQPAVTENKPRSGEVDGFWAAVVTRDVRCERTFVYGVSSTRIYCRPTCPSRRPRRERVRFFNSWEAAEDAGYRPCRRCHPSRTSDPRLDGVQHACRLSQDADTSLSLAGLAARVELSPHTLRSAFKQILGVSPREYGAAWRMEATKSQLRQEKSVTEALNAGGYRSTRALYETAPARLGMTPRDYSRGGDGMKVNYFIAPCELGQLLIAATERGLCAAALGDDCGELLLDLQNEFPQATLQADQDGLRDWMQLVLHHLEGTQPTLDLPLDVRATAFQARVWAAVRTIAYGRTSSYSELARAIGQPSAVRAVARACASNPVALVTPCHRVVRSNGAPSGYRWGINRKEKLLAAEARNAAAPRNDSQ